MKIIIDNKVPYIRPLLDGLGADIRFMEPRDITRDAVADADALIVRTRTRCDASLLGGSRVKFVGTATIGLDHIDIPWCRANGITVANAPGCNAPAVAQWVFRVIARLRPDARVLGIVGVGNVGSLVARWARSMGMEVLLNDPARQARGELPEGVSLDEIAARADVVTFHPTLNPTSFHLASTQLFNAMSGRDVLLLNASRGPVVDTRALVAALRDGRVADAAIDTWEGEPRLGADALELMSLARIATPHIAGYSLPGKKRAALMVANALRRSLGVAEVEIPGLPPVANEMTLARVADSYDILADDANFRAAPTELERLRDTYALRPEA